jgi:DNA helicase HerA-like ATPase
VDRSKGCANSLSQEDEIGIVVGETKPEKITFVAKQVIRIGDYVTINTEDGLVVYMVEDSKNLSELLSKPNDYQTIEEARRASSKNPRDRIKMGVARALGLVNELLNGKRIYPTIPPEPGASVKPVDDILLEKIYGVSGKRWATIGTLLRRPKVRVSIDLNMLSSRHLAILATTGKGKSNLLALIAKKVSEKHGTMIIFDYHGEYSNLQIPKIKITVPKINPRNLDADELADVIGVRKDADRQRYLLQKIYTKEAKTSKDFWSVLVRNLRSIMEDEETPYQEKLVARRLEEIIDRALIGWGKIFDLTTRNVLDIIVNNRINILDISEFTEYQSQILISHFLDAVLEDRKNALRGGECKFKSPVIIAIEEAHVFIPSNKQTRCSENVAKIAREGRKFGVSLIIVSQRPSRLDADIISQIGNFAISGLIHPRDQSFIADVTDDVSEELKATLPSLNPGEMIFVGNFVRAPALVKVDLVEEKLIGRDLDTVQLWEEEFSQEAYISTEELIKR